MAKEKLVQVGAKAATKAARSAFKNLISELENIGTRSAIGERRGGFGNYSWYPGTALFTEPVLASKSGTAQLDPLRSVLSQRMADPVPAVTEALSTGRLDGVRLSANQRRALAAGLQRMRDERAAVEGLDTFAFTANPSAKSTLPAPTQYLSRREYPNQEKIGSLLSNKIDELRYASPSTRRDLERYYPSTEKVVEQAQKLIAGSKNLPPAIRERLSLIHI